MQRLNCESLLKAYPRSAVILMLFTCYLTLSGVIDLYKTLHSKCLMRILKHRPLECSYKDVEDLSTSKCW